METHPEHIAPCGLYCGVCRIYHATQEDDRTFLQRLVNIYKRRFPEIAAATADELLCDGCLSTSGDMAETVEVRSHTLTSFVWRRGAAVFRKTRPSGRASGTHSSLVATARSPKDLEEAAT
jgi:hypothetical protein